MWLKTSLNRSGEGAISTGPEAVVLNTTRDNADGEHDGTDRIVADTTAGSPSRPSKLGLWSGSSKSARLCFSESAWGSMLL